MKALPPQREIDYTKECEYWSEILNMCSAPSARNGKKCRIVRLSDTHPENSPRIGLTGVIRPFNPVDFKTLYNDYLLDLRFESKRLRNLKAVYDFFPYEIKEGKKRLSIFHYHIEQSQFETLEKTQLTIKFST